MSVVDLRPQHEETDDGEVDGTFWPIVPDGEYVAQFIHHETARLFRTKKNPEGTCKVFMIFELKTPPEHAGKRLYRAYRASGLPKRIGKHGRFRVRKGSDLLRVLHLLFGNSGRMDRITLRPLKHVLLRIKVRTVVRDWRQRELPESLRYSVVDDLMAIEAGDLHAL